jgi:rare lipoprotein A
MEWLPQGNATPHCRHITPLCALQQDQAGVFSVFRWFIAACAAGFLSLAAIAEAGSSVGMASYYKSGKRTANGEKYNPMGFTAAHRSLPFGTKVLVTNVRTGKSVIVRINDRGPFIRGRIIDLSLGAARVVGLTATGVARVKITVLGT